MARKSTRLRRMVRWFRSEAGRRVTHRMPALAVAVVAAWVSYWHMVTVATRAGEPGITPYLAPLSVDALMIVSALYITRARRTAGTAWAVIGFTLGTTATLTANVLSAQPTTLGRAVAAWPALALVLTAGILHWGEMRPRRKARAKASQAAVQATTTPNGYRRVRKLVQATTEA